MNYSKLLLTTQSGHLHTLDNGELKTHFQSAEMGGIMGVIVDENTYYISSLNRIYKFDKDFNNIGISMKSNAEFHHMNMYMGLIYVAGTLTNKIYVFDKNLNLKNEIQIKPPSKNRPIARKVNYNHLNTVVKKNKKFYVNLNWLTNAQYGMSGVAVFNEDWKEIERFEMAWESHDFQFDGDDMVVICATSSKDKPIKHPLKSGIMINGNLVFEHDPNESFCKGLTWDSNYYYLCGGEKTKRENRKSTKGIIYIVDKKTHKLIEKLTNFGVNNIKGCKVI